MVANATHFIKIHYKVSNWFDFYLYFTVNNPFILVLAGILNNIK